LLGGKSGGVGSDEGHHIIIAVIAPPTATATAVKALTIFLIASAQASARCPTSSACIILEYHTFPHTKIFFLLSYSLMAGSQNSHNFHYNNDRTKFAADADASSSNGTLNDTNNGEIKRAEHWRPPSGPNAKKRTSKAPSKKTSEAIDSGSLDPMNKKKSTKKSGSVAQVFNSKGHNRGAHLHGTSLERYHYKDRPQTT